MQSTAVMTREVMVVPPELELAAAARLMERLRIRHLPVVRAGELVGILSDRDVLRLGGRRAERAGLTVGEAMTPAPITCSAQASVRVVAELMLEYKIDAIPILGGNERLVGIVTSTDLIGLLVDRNGADALPFDFRLNTFEQAAETSAAS